MASAKLKMLRILEILSQTDEDSPLTALQIAKKLEKYGISAERKSICRDINMLTEEAGYDIMLMPDNKLGYYMASREFEDWELKVLIDSVNSSSFLPSGDSDKLISKLQNQTSDGGKKLLKASTALKNEGRTKSSSVKINIDTVLQAIRRKRKIEFLYTDTDSEGNMKARREGRSYIVNPYALVRQDDGYFLICNYDKYDNLSFYRLSKMKSVSICESKRKPIRDIYGEDEQIALQNYVNNSVYRFSGEQIKLVLEVSTSACDHLTERFGESVRFIPHGEKLRAHIVIGESEGLIFWLLQYADNLKVISPQSVRDSLVEKLQAMTKLYEVRE